MNRFESSKFPNFFLGENKTDTLLTLSHIQSIDMSNITF